MSIGSYIRNYLSSNERSIRWLAIRAGMSDGYLHGIINNKHTPSIDKLTALADAMGVTAMGFLVESGAIPAEWDGVAEEKAHYSSDLLEALGDPEMREIIRKIWKLKKGNPGVDVREFLDRYLSLPESKKMAVLAMIE